MEDERFVDLCGQLAEKPDFLSRLNSCKTQEEVYTLFNDSGVSNEEFDEMRAKYKEFKAQDDLNGEFCMCLLAGFGSSAVCTGLGGNDNKDPDNGKNGAGGLGCDVFGLGFGATMPDSVMDAVKEANQGVHVMDDVVASTAGTVANTIADGFNKASDTVSTGVGVMDKAVETAVASVFGCG